MAMPPLVRTLPHLRHILSPQRRPLFSFLLPKPDESSPSCSSSSSSPSPTHSQEETVSSSTITEPKQTPNLSTYSFKPNPNHRASTPWQRQIARDIEPIVRIVKDILHSSRYMNGDRLTPDDEKALVEKLLPYHPHSEDKIGCGIAHVSTGQIQVEMDGVDRNPIFPDQRCLFVVRTDGDCIDFSYQKCLREYVRKKFPSHAERFDRAKLLVSYRNQRKIRLWAVGRML